MQTPAADVFFFLPPNWTYCFYLQFRDKHLSYSVYDQSACHLRTAVCILYFFVLCVQQIVSVRRCGGFIGIGGWEGAAAVILSCFKDTERQTERRGERGEGVKMAVKKG